MYVRARKNNLVSRAAPVEHSRPVRHPLPPNSHLALCFRFHQTITSNEHRLFDNMSSTGGNVPVRAYAILMSPLSYDSSHEHEARPVARALRTDARIVGLRYRLPHPTASQNVAAGLRNQKRSFRSYIPVWYCCSPGTVIWCLCLFGSVQSSLTKLSDLSPSWPTSSLSRTEGMIAAKPFIAPFLEKHDNR